MCVHGVFGSGKSYLLAVLVLALTRVLADKHRVLVASTTNVAVDNILLKLVVTVMVNLWIVWARVLLS